MEGSNEKDEAEEMKHALSNQYGRNLKNKLDEQGYATGMDILLFFIGLGLRKVGL